MAGGRSRRGRAACSSRAWSASFDHFVTKACSSPAPERSNVAEAFREILWKTLRRRLADELSPRSWRPRLQTCPGHPAWSPSEDSSAATRPAAPAAHAVAAAAQPAAQPVRPRQRQHGRQDPGPRADEDQHRGCGGARPSLRRCGTGVQRPRRPPRRRGRHGRDSPGRGAALDRRLVRPARARPDRHAGQARQSQRAHARPRQLPAGPGLCGAKHPGRGGAMDRAAARPHRHQRHPSCRATLRHPNEKEQTHDGRRPCHPGKRHPGRRCRVLARALGIDIPPGGKHPDMARTTR